LITGRTPVDSPITGDEGHPWHKFGGVRKAGVCYFRREHGQWQVVQKETPQASENFRKMVNRPGMSEEQAMLEMLRKLSKSDVSEQILDGPLD